jgi:hypothetical protein
LGEQELRKIGCDECVQLVPPNLWLLSQAGTRWGKCVRHDDLLLRMRVKKFLVGSELPTT